MKNERIIILNDDGVILAEHMESQGFMPIKSAPGKVTQILKYSTICPYCGDVALIELKVSAGARCECLDRFNVLVSYLMPEFRSRDRVMP